MPQLTDEEQHRRLALLDTVFRPSAPVDDQDLFSGRNHQLASVLEASRSVGQHAVIFGERGVGKTSLAAVCAELARHARHVSMRVNCDGGDDFSGLWQKVIDEFQIALGELPEDWRRELEPAMERATEVLNVSDLSPNVVRVALRNITAHAPVVVFFDEFDQIDDEHTLALFSNTIKLLSDQIERVTLIPVGVSNSVEGLVHGHQSIQRALVQVKMPRMTPDEIIGIVEKGLAQLDMTADEHSMRFLRKAPRGLPQYAHLLAQEGARQALLASRSDIVLDDVMDGLRVGLAKLDHTLSAAYDRATYSPRATRFREVLFACVIANLDESGYFSPTDLKGPYSTIIGEDVDIPRFNPQLVQLCQERGGILCREGSERKWRYRFTDPLMEPFVLMKGIASGLLKPEQIAG